MANEVTGELLGRYRVLCLGDSYDGSRDQVIQTVHQLTVDRLMLFVNALVSSKGGEPLKELPPALDVVIQEVTLKRINRLGSEGMTAESVEGHSMQFESADKDFSPYEDLIRQVVLGKDAGARREGEVMIW